MILFDEVKLLESKARALCEVFGLGPRYRKVDN